MSLFVYPPVTLSISGNATEATQLLMLAELEDINTNTAGLTDVASETTLSSIDGKITAVDTGNVTVAASALPTGAATSANQATANASLSNIESDLANLNARLAGNLVPETFDFLSLTYVTSGDGIGEIETVTYKTGGSGGTTVATLTLTYDANDSLSTVTRS